ncbi:helix-turn-helix transcriptional regulator [Oscillospiraceae bacterium 50-58]
MDYVLLGKRIRDERLLLRLTLEKLAERTDKSINFIGQIERGEGKPSLETMVDIANALGTTVDSLLQDNVKAVNDSVGKEVEAIIRTLDDNGKQFILDMVKRYSHYHQPPSNSL